MTDIKGTFDCPNCNGTGVLRIDKMTRDWRNVTFECQCGYKLTGEMDEEYVLETGLERKQTKHGIF